MLKYFSVLFLCIFLSQMSFAGIKAAVGLELGGNGTMMLSDPSVQIFAGGAGLQGSLHYSMWNERPIGGKLRFEVVGIQESALQKSNTSYILPGTSLKAMSQSWYLMSLGAEGRFTRHGQSVFWEGLLGYALARSGTMSVTSSTFDQAPIATVQDVSSALVLSGGAGIKRIFTDKITGIMSLRTFVLLAPVYASSALSSKTLVPIPVMFNVGVEMPFEF